MRIAPRNCAVVQGRGGRGNRHLGVFGGVLQGRGSLVVLAWCGHVRWVRAAGIGDRIR